MKKICSFIIITLLFCAVTVTGCGNKEKEYILNATVIEAYEGMLLVEPVEGSSELNSVLSVYVYLKDADRDLSEYYPVGASVVIGYDGTILETSPGQLYADYIKLKGE